MNPTFSFSTVKREQCKASIVIEGLSGMGKSGLALVLAKALSHGWETVYDIDTENGSIKLYDGIDCSSGGTFGGFQVANFTPDIKYKPSHYVAFKEAALAQGATTVINDSISHAWQYAGGILDMIAEKKKNNTRYQKDSYAAWGDEEIVKEKQELLELLRDSRCHVISTVRVKEKMEYETDPATGKTKLVSLGEQQIMQGDMKYEPDLVLHMEAPGSKDKAPKARVVKSRYKIFEVDQVYEFTEKLCEQLAKYLEEGTNPNELLEQQRQEYVTGVKEYLDAHPTAVPVWNMLKKDAGFEDKKLNEIPLEAIRKIFNTLTLE